MVFIRNYRVNVWSAVNETMVILCTYNTHFSTHINTAVNLILTVLEEMTYEVFSIYESRKT